MKKIILNLCCLSLLISIFSPLTVNANSLVEDSVIVESMDVGEVDSEFIQEKSVWDALDVGMAGYSWYQLIKNPSLSNLGWAVLDTAAILPLVPSSQYVRIGSKVYVPNSSITNLAKTTSGKTALTRAIRQTLTSSETTKALRLASSYKFPNSAYVHILQNHSATIHTTKSTFLNNSAIKSLVNDTLMKPTSIRKNTDGRSGYIYVKDFGRVVGYASGKKNPVTKVKVVVNSSGNIVTAYPYNYH